MKTAIVTTRHGAQDDRIYFKQALTLAKRIGVTLIAPEDQRELAWADGIEYKAIPRRHGVFGRIRSLGEAWSRVCAAPWPRRDGLTLDAEALNPSGFFNVGEYKNGSLLDPVRLVRGSYQVC